MTGTTRKGRAAVAVAAALLLLTPVAAGAAPALSRTAPAASEQAPSQDPVTEDKRAMRYQGGRVLMDPRVHVVFWGSDWGQPDANGMPTADPLGVAPMVLDFYGRLGGKGDTWSTILTQYCIGTKINDKTCGPGSRKIPRLAKSPLRGWWIDSTPGPGQPAADVKVGAWHEPANRGLKHFQATHPDDIVVLMMPPGADSATDCTAFHTVANTDAGKRPLIVMHYPVPRPTCPGSSPVCDLGKPDTCTPKVEYTIQKWASHEWAEVVTNPFPTNCLRSTGVCGWIVKDAPAYASRPEPLQTEISDTCATYRFAQLNGKKTVVAALWSNTANKGKGDCVTRYVSDKDQN